MKLCDNCGYVGMEGSADRGSTGLEIAFWLLGIVTYGIFFIVAIIYTLWRHAFSPKGCPKCKYPFMKPLPGTCENKYAPEYKIQQAQLQIKEYEKRGYEVPDKMRELASKKLK